MQQAIAGTATNYSPIHSARIPAAPVRSLYNVMAAYPCVCIPYPPKVSLTAHSLRWAFFKSTAPSAACRKPPVSHKDSLV